MGTQALVDASGSVVNVIVVGEDRFALPEGLSALDVSGIDPRPAIGWRYEAGTFIAPLKPDPEPTAFRNLSFLEFMDLFTQDEQLAIAGAAMTDVATKLWYDRAVGAQYIDLGDERLTDGLQKMVDAKLLTAARKAKVLQGLKAS